MAPGSSPSKDGVFTSWKEIAAYLGKGVRTVQRWESRFGLPVRRPHEESHSVLVSREELDAWLSTRWSQRPRNFQIPEALSGAKSRKSAVEIHLELRSEHHQVLADMRRALQGMSEQRRILLQQITHLQTLLLQEVLSQPATKNQGPTKQAAAAAGSCRNYHCF